MHTTITKQPEQVTNPTDIFREIPAKHFINKYFLAGDEPIEIEHWAGKIIDSGETVLQGRKQQVFLVAFFNDDKEEQLNFTKIVRQEEMIGWQFYDNKDYIYT